MMSYPHKTEADYRQVVLRGDLMEFEKKERKRVRQFGFCLTKEYVDFFLHPCHLSFGSQVQRDYLSLNFL